jgi:hypothetical protein
LKPNQLLSVDGDVIWNIVITLSKESHLCSKNEQYAGVQIDSN